MEVGFHCWWPLWGRWWGRVYFGWTLAGVVAWCGRDAGNGVGMSVRCRVSGMARCPLLAWLPLWGGGWLWGVVVPSVRSLPLVAGLVFRGGGWWWWLVLCENWIVDASILIFL